jgi:hypothetical protein
MEDNFKREPVPTHEQVKEFLLPDTDPFDQVGKEPNGESKTGGVPSSESSSTSADDFDQKSF